MANKFRTGAKRLAGNIIYAHNSHARAHTHTQRERERERETLLHNVPYTCSRRASALEQVSWFLSLTCSKATQPWLVRFCFCSSPSHSLVTVTSHSRHHNWSPRHHHHALLVGKDASLLVRQQWLAVRWSPSLVGDAAAAAADDNSLSVCLINAE